MVFLAEELCSLLSLPLGSTVLGAVVFSGAWCRSGLVWWSRAPFGGSPFGRDPCSLMKLDIYQTPCFKCDFPFSVQFDVKCCSVVVFSAALLCSVPRMAPPLRSGQWEVFGTSH